MTLASVVAAPAALARTSVTVDVGPAIGLFRGIAPLHTTVAAGVGQSQERSCEARRSKSPSSTGLGRTTRKGSVVACEQPPRSSLNLTNLKHTEANAIAALG